MFKKKEFGMMIGTNYEKYFIKISVVQNLKGD